MSQQRHSLAPMQIFTLPPDALATLRTLSTIADHYPLSANHPDEHREQLSVYFDTTDYRLLRTGFAVQMVQDNQQCFLTVENLAAALVGKVDKQIGRRQPVIAPIACNEKAATLKAWPKALRKAVSPVLAGHPKLHPILWLQRKRTTFTVAASANEATPSAPAAILAVLYLDEITVWAPTDGTHPLEVPAPEYAVTSFAQLGIEFANTTAMEATTTDQETITTWLTQQLDLEPTEGSHQSLLQQSLLASARHTPTLPGVVGMQPQMLVADACRLIWREQLMAMLGNEAGVRYSQDAEYVHDMRVAIRRARAVAKLYGHFLPHKLVRPYLAALRKTGRFLGFVRNLDVTLAKAHLQNQEETGIQAPKKLLKVWRQQRHAAHEALVRWLDSNEYSNFLAEFRHFCMTSEAPSKHPIIDAYAPQQVRHVIPAQILACFAAVRCYEVLFEAATPVDYATLHELRIACKYLRYNLEFARHLLGSKSEMLITRLKALQELLGNLNDAVVAQTLMDEAKQVSDADAFQQAQSALVAELTQRVPAALAALVDQECRKQLGRALARL